MRKVLAVVLSLLLGYLVTDQLGLIPEYSGRPSDRVFAADKELPSFITLADKLSPAVVNISTSQSVESPQWFPGPFPNPFGEQDHLREFWEEFFRHQFPHQGRFQQRSLGSGFIIDSDGHILTNNHVIRAAEKIVVKLSDGRTYQAKVIGRDAKTDIALIKIDAEGSLTTVSLGDSDKLQVGEWILAIGNPFGLDRTVTAGIVSAKGRIIGAGPYDDFIQTDASINPGNSGGPLINLHGQVVGVNTAIFSRSGGNIGIGFAIPINLIKELVPELKSKGKVVRGWLGIMIQKVTPTLAESLGLEKPRGALVSSVSADSPASRAGIKAGDVIVEFDEKTIERSDALSRIVARTPVGKRVQVEIIRNKEEMNLSVSVGELKEEEAVASAKEGKDLGLIVENVTPAVAERLGLDRAEGVVIKSIRPGSLADEGGFRRGDVILEIDRKKIQSVSDFQKVMSSRKKDQVILILVDRGEATLFLTLRG